MRRICIILSCIFVLGILSGCGKRAAKLNIDTAPKIVVLTIDNKPRNLEEGIANEYDRVITWMNRDIIKVLKNSGFEATLIKSKKEYRSANGKLLVMNVSKLDVGNRGMRIFVGFGAGAASLDIDYKLYKNGKKLHQWTDGVGSSRGGTYCAQTLNRNVANKLVTYFNK